MFFKPVETAFNRVLRCCDSSGFVWQLHSLERLVHVVRSIYVTRTSLVVRPAARPPAHVISMLLMGFFRRRTCRKDAVFCRESQHEIPRKDLHVSRTAFRRQSFLFQLRRPIHHERDRGGSQILNERVDDKPATITRDIKIFGNGRRVYLE